MHTLMVVFVLLLLLKPVIFICRVCALVFMIWLIPALFACGILLFAVWPFLSMVLAQPMALLRKIRK